MSIEEAGAFIGVIFTVLAAGGAGLIGALATVWVAWDRKIKPLLQTTSAAAQTAAHELTNNSGSSARDVVDRIEEVARDIRAEQLQARAELSTVRTDLSTLAGASRATHAEIFKRLRVLETDKNKGDHRHG